MDYDKELDARGLSCPLPILRAKKALNDMAFDQVLRILTTDPGSVRDFAAFSEQTGNRMLASGEISGSNNTKEFEFFIKRK
jgi:tRNA 2-thiouridine synthesizing protein A